jgi:prefoldin subunit 5
MDSVGSSLAAKMRTAKADRTYARLKAEFEKARRELAEAIVAERKEGEKIEDITARVTYRQGQVNRILEAAGLTEKRAKRED